MINMKRVLTILLLCTALLGTEVMIVKARKDRQFPYHGFLIVNDVYTGGATLITSSHLLTAAHCVDDIVRKGSTTAITYVKLGSKTLFDGIDYIVKRISHHLKFTKKTSYKYIHDIAVITLKYQVELSTSISPIGLPAEDVEVSDKVIVSGCGLRNVKKILSFKLSKNKAKILSIQECQKNFIENLTYTEICASVEPNLGSVMDDSGNPLVNESKSTIFGISSFGTSLYSTDGLKIYTAVSFYLKYIDQEINYFHPNVAISIKSPAINFEEVKITNYS